MASKTLNVSEEAYDLLKARKKEGESFTDVIKRLAGERSLEELVGILSERQAKDLRESIRAGRARSRRRAKRMARKFRQ